MVDFIGYLQRNITRSGDVSDYDKPAVFRRVWCISKIINKALQIAIYTSLTGYLQSFHVLHGCGEQTLLGCFGKSPHAAVREPSGSSSSSTHEMAPFDNPSKACIYDYPMHILFVYICLNFTIPHFAESSLLPRLSEPYRRKLLFRQSLAGVVITPYAAICEKSVTWSIVASIPSCSNAVLSQLQAGCILQPLPKTFTLAPSVFALSAFAILSASQLPPQQHEVVFSFLFFFPNSAIFIVLLYNSVL